MLKRLLLALAVLLATAVDADVAQGQRANIGDVAKSVRGEATQPYGPTDLPRQPESEDGRSYVYMEVIFVSAIRDRRPARTYSFWPRLTMSEDASTSNFWRARARVRDAMLMALTEIVQVDWGGEAQLDSDLAEQFARRNADAAMGGGKLDAIDFLHIEVEVF